MSALRGFAASHSRDLHHLRTKWESIRKRLKRDKKLTRGLRDTIIDGMAHHIYFQFSKQEGLCDRFRSVVARILAVVRSWQSREQGMHPEDELSRRK
jgi:hypothetical protein